MPLPQELFLTSHPGSLLKLLIRDNHPVIPSHIHKRKHVRYPLKEKGYIESVIVDGTLIELQKPIEMETCNISGNGILIQTMAGSGTVGTELRICVKLGDTMLQKTYRIVRIQNANLKTEEYGCMMIRDRNI